MWMLELYTLFACARICESSEQLQSTVLNEIVNGPSVFVNIAIETTQDKKKITDKVSACSTKGK